MTAAAMTNYGREWMASVAFRGAHPQATSDGDVGLQANGASVPSFWVLLMNSNYNFTQSNGGPNRDHMTVALIGGANVIAPASYTNNWIERNRVRYVTTHDPVGDLARLAFVPGQEPLITVTSNIVNVAGWALCRDNAGNASTHVLAIYGFSNGVIQEVLANEQIRLTASEGTLI